jgi:membrane protein YqaA with SNARE-associated domain
MKNIILSKPATEKSSQMRQTFIAFLWGLAESSFFFIVPDVWLTLIARRRLGKSQYRVVGAALLGALAGGTLVYFLAQGYPQKTPEWISYIPGINPSLVRKVRIQTENCGLLALMLGPLRGIPYKIYALHWGVAHGSLVWFWIISVPARGIRFLITAALTRLIWIFGETRIKLWKKLDRILLLSFWSVFYVYYFHHFGW